MAPENFELEEGGYAGLGIAVDEQPVDDLATVELDPAQLEVPPEWQRLLAFGVSYLEGDDDQSQFSQLLKHLAPMALASVAGQINADPPGARRKALELVREVINALELTRGELAIRDWNDDGDG